MSEAMLNSTDCSLPTKEELQADPDRVLELIDNCPVCGSNALEAITWKSIGLPDVTVGCWECGWMQCPGGHELKNGEVIKAENILSPENGAESELQPTS